MDEILPSLNQSKPCSGHGEFMTTTNTCFCDIRFSGSSCSGTNINYHLTLSITYLIVALVSLIQLVTSMVMSILNNGKESGSKSKTPSISSSSDDHQNQNGVGESSSSLHHPPIQIQQRNNLRGIIAHSAFREALTPTTPKAIYAVVFLMSSMRAAYFAASATLTGDWLLSSLLSAYYPLLLTGSSLIVCFWAEIFHLRDKRIVSYKYLSHRFLGKSFLGFLSFNVITYSLLLAQLLLILSNTADQKEKSYYLNIFNGCYAFLILIVVIFFLIYGVEVYFKLRIEDYLKSRKSNKNKEVNKHEELIGKFQPGAANANTPLNEKSELSYKVNTSQLHQSRLGLISQASMLIVTVLFILSDICGEFWKNKIPIEGRNYHNIMFSLVEIGCTLWFPCVLWNVHRPEQLWVLNPKKIINSARRNSSNPSGSDAKLQAGESYNPIDSNINQEQDDESEETESDISESSHVGCYFCYDPDRTDAGDLIQPCACRGDVGSVHHDCLKKWLIQQAGQLENQDDDHEFNGLTSTKQPKKPLQIPEISCSICKTPYSIVKPSFIRRRGENSSSAFSFNPSYATSALTSCASISSQHWLKLSLLLSLISGIFMFTFALCHILPTPPYKVLVVGIALILLYLILKFLGQNTLSAYQQAKVSSLTILSLRRRASSDEENIENAELNNGMEPSSSTHITTENNLTNNMHKTLIAEDIILTHSSSGGGHTNSRNFFELSPGGLRGVKDKSPPIQIIKASSKQNTHNSVPKN